MRMPGAIDLETPQRISQHRHCRPGVSRSYTRVVEINPTTKAIEWQYADAPHSSFYCPFIGNAQRLWNGNTHFTDATSVLEVTPKRDVVWEYVIPFFGEYPAPQSSF